jgi:hypothetical protein
MGKDMRKWLGNSATTALLLLAGALGFAHVAGAQTLGTISVEPRPVDPHLRAAVATFVDEVDRALAEKGFTTIERAGHARFVAELSLTRTEVGTTTAKVPVAGSEIVSGGSSSQVGGGVTVMLPTAKVRTVPLQQTRLEVRIKKRGEDIVIWHGAALTVRAAGQDKAISADLTRTIFRTYPEQAEGVASIP